MRSGIVPPPRRSGPAASARPPGPPQLRIARPDRPIVRRDRRCGIAARPRAGSVAIGPAGRPEGRTAAHARCRPRRRSDRPDRIRGRGNSSAAKERSANAGCGEPRPTASRAGRSESCRVRTRSERRRAAPTRSAVRAPCSTRRQSRRSVAGRSPRPTAGQIPFPAPHPRPEDQWSPAATIRSAETRRRRPNSRNGDRPGPAARHANRWARPPGLPTPPFPAVSRTS